MRCLASNTCSYATSSVDFVLSLPLGLLNHRAGSLALPALVSQASSALLNPPQAAQSFGTQGEAFPKASHSLLMKGGGAAAPEDCRRRCSHLAQSSRCSLCPACRRAGAGERRLFRQPPTPRFIPPSGSIGALTRCRSHRLFRQPPSPLPYPPLAGSGFRSHWRRFGFGARGRRKE